LITVLGVLAGAVSPAPAADAAGRQAGQDRRWPVTRPGGAPEDRLTATVGFDGTDGTLTLSVRRGSATLLQPAPLGIVTEAADLTSGLRPAGSVTRQVTEDYSTTTGKQRERSARMTQTTLSFTGEGGARLDVVVRVARDGVAYRYVLPERREVTVLEEASAFRLPASSRAWLKRYTVNYERPHTRTTAAGAESGDYGYPSLFEVGDDLVLLTESDVDGRYAGSRLTHREGSAAYGVELADARITAPGPLATPWRTAVIGDPATVTGSTLVDDLAPRSRIGDTSWIRPGRVAWSWLAGFAGAQRDLDMQKRFVDYSAAHGWEYTLVDEGWKSTGWMPRLIEYAQRRGVGILLWMHWTDLDTAAEREETLSRVRGWGAAGLKIDFMDSDSQARMRWYDEILRATAGHRLLVNFHGSTLPHGIQRTWPHVMTMEAVHGAEQGDVSREEAVTLPYTRNVVGSMDYTPMGLQFGRRNLTDAAELALSVVYESGLQHYAGSVEVYRERPRLERFLEQVPTVWDETRLLSGRPGDGATFARRHADRWFLGGVFADGPATRRIPLGFLPGGRWRVETVRDGQDGLVRESRVVGREDVLEIPAAAGGGFAGLVCRDRPGRTTCDEPVRRLPLTVLTARPDRSQADPGTVVEVDARYLVEEFGPVRDVTLGVSVPKGWEVDGAGAEAGELPTGRPLDTRWRVRIPRDAAYGYGDVVVSARYAVPGAAATAPRLRSERTLRVFVSPPGVDYVSDLAFAAERNGWGPVERDTSNGESGRGDGGPLRIRGTTYDKGLGVHAESEVSLDVSGGYERFTARVGVDDEAGGAGAVAFEVVGDGRTLAGTGVLTGSDPAVALDVDVTGVRRLTLRVLDGGDGIGFDHADWGDALLRTAD
jgi:hypothetical protein